MDPLREGGEDAYWGGDYYSEDEFWGQVRVTSNYNSSKWSGTLGSMFPVMSPAIIPISCGRYSHGFDYIPSPRPVFPHLPIFHNATTHTSRSVEFSRIINLEPGYNFFLGEPHLNLNLHTMPPVRRLTRTQNKAQYYQPTAGPSKTKSHKDRDKDKSSHKKSKSSSSSSSSSKSKDKGKGKEPSQAEKSLVCEVCGDRFSQKHMLKYVSTTITKFSPNQLTNGQANTWQSTPVL